jgi:CheY-like chemotaxis protein
MSESLTVELIRAAPAALWVLFALIVYLTLRPVIRRKLDNLATVRTQGVEMNFAAALLEAATTETQDADVQPGTEPAEPAERQTSDSERLSGVSRLDHAAKFIAGRRILWVDDRPRRNVSLTTLFRSIGLAVDEATSTDQAGAMLKQTRYDLVITDGYRPEHGLDRADLALIDTVGRQAHRLPVILFTNRKTIQEGASSELFAFTTDGDNLVQYVIDVMERLWFGIPPRRPRRRT